MSIGTTIKTIQDVMRKDAGVDGDAQRISQLVWMMFLKVFDDREAEKELMDDGYRSPIPQRLRWRNWAKDAEGVTGDALLDFVNNDLFKALKDLPATGKNTNIALVVRSVFEDAYNYMKSGTLMRQVINRLNEIDFNRAGDRHAFGDIYEQILADLQTVVAEARQLVFRQRPRHRAAIFRRFAPAGDHQQRAARRDKAGQLGRRGGLQRRRPLRP